MSATNPTLDWSLLQQFWDLMEDDGEAVEDLVETFIKDTPKTLESLQNACESGDQKEIGRLAHTLKGSCGTIGAAHLSNLCLIIESAAKKDDGADFKALGEPLAGAFKEASETLLRWREHLNEPS